MWLKEQDCIELKQNLFMVIELRSALRALFLCDIHYMEKHEVPSEARLTVRSVQCMIQLAITFCIKKFPIGYFLIIVALIMETPN